MADQLNELSIDPKLINYNVEFSLIRYLHSNPDRLSFYDKKYFLTYETACCFQALTETNYSNTDFNSFIRIVSGNYKDTIIEDKLLRAFAQSDIINEGQEETYRYNLLNNYTKYKLQKQVFEKIEVIAKEKGWAKYDDLINLSTALRTIAYDLKGEQEIRLQSAYDLFEEHKQVINDRELGKKLRTLGYPEIDEMLVKPGAEGEITTFVALTGIGKSLVLKNLEYKIIANPYVTNKVCVLSLNMEMTNESIMDRYLSMYHNFDLKKLQNKDEIAKRKKEILKALRVFAGYDNYLYVSEPNIDFDILESIVIPKAKSYFKSKGLLPEDEYMIVTFDALTHLNDFDDGKNTDYELAMKKQAQLAKTHNVHCINVVQANENKFRYGTRFKNHTELDHFILGLEDIFGSSAISKYSRAVFSLNRPLAMKQRFFPMEKNEWEVDYGSDGAGDVLHLNLIKQNDGHMGMKKFIVQPNMLITALLEKG